MMFPDDTIALAKNVIEALISKQQMIVTAESCTGGLIAGALTSVPGSSEVVYGGFVTYANEAKIAMIDVTKEAIETHGAVSQKVARLMAEGALRTSGAGISIAVTGVAGPGGGTLEKPVGLVHLGCTTKDETVHIEMRYGEVGREAIRLATVNTALELVLETLRT